MAIWQTIDTAPKDGTEILVCDSSYGVEPVQTAIFVGDSCRASSGGTTLNDEWNDKELSPSYWMHKPKPYWESEQYKD